MSVRKLSKVKAHDRCPRCATTLLKRGAVKSGTDIDGMALWDFTEACIICPWESTTPTVKVGA